MVVRVARQAARSQAQAVTVATDSPQVIAACAAHGVHAILTRADHPSGSDRLAEACDILGLHGDEVVLNVQGDEPLIDPALITACAARLHSDRACVMATVAHAIDSVEEWLNPHVVKVVLSAQQRALYFSRSPLPAWRDRTRTRAWQKAPHPSCGMWASTPIGRPFFANFQRSRPALWNSRKCWSSCAYFGMATASRSM